MPLDERRREPGAPTFNTEAAELAARPWFQRHATKLHALGPRGVAEFIAEIMVRCPEQDRDWIAARLARYAGFDGDLVPGFAPVPLRAVPPTEPEPEKARG